MKQNLLITGASHGLDAEIAIHTACEHFDIFINYVKNHKQADMAKETQIVEMFKAVDNELGPIYRLIYNAGITGKFCSVDESDHSTAQQVKEIHTLGGKMPMRQAVKHMLTAQGGTGGLL